MRYVNLKATTLLLFLAAAAQASPVYFDLDYTTVDSDTVSAVLTTTEVAPGEYLVTGISGTRDGDAITGLEPAGTLGLNDNYLFMPGNPNYLDGDGIAFAVGSTEYDVFAGEGNNYYIEDWGYSGDIYGGAVIENLSDPATPEPGTMGLLAVGALVLVGRRWRRSKP
jgi:hypothetical protein